ncbi:PIN domain-containing protein [candidate division KSB1 bacterium]|nr:PIN domain-containing protein [candidate division KSB1 bacterium]
MIFETCDRFNLHMSAARTYLKNTPRAIKSLSQYRQALDLIYRLPRLTILTINPTLLRQSHGLIAKYQLLSSDAIHASTCLAYGIHLPRLRHPSYRDE